MDINLKEVKLAGDVNTEEIGTLCEGYSGADITNVCRSVKLATVMYITNCLVISLSYVLITLSTLDFVEYIVATVKYSNFLSYLYVLITLSTPLTEMLP